MEVSLTSRIEGVESEMSSKDCLELQNMKTEMRVNHVTDVI
jgi:hypothetical protein